MLNLRKSIANLFCKAIHAPFLKFNFTLYPSKHERKLVANDKPPEEEDDLKYPHESESVTGGLQNVINKRKPFIYL